MEMTIANEVIDHKKYVRDNHKWYPEWIKDTITRDVGSKELHDYFLTDSTYRNRVVFVYDLVYNNYLRSLNALIKGLTTFKEEINEILKKTND
jgi:hypothetical protein